LAFDCDLKINNFSVDKAQACDGALAWDIRSKAILLGCKNTYPVEQLKIWVGGTMPKKFAQAMEDNGYVAKISGKMVAMVMLNIQTARVDGLFVYPEYMGRGIARVLMGLVEKVASKENLARLHLESTLNAASFYRACGFVGDIVTAYPTKNKRLHIDCIPMEKLLET